MIWQIKKTKLDKIENNEQIFIDKSFFFTERKFHKQELIIINNKLNGKIIDKWEDYKDQIRL